MPLADTYRKIRPACTAIAIGRGDPKSTTFFSFGSGACIHADGIVVTAKHVVTDYFAQMTGEATFPKKLPKESFFVLFTRRASNRFELASAKPIEVLLHPTSDAAFLRVNPLPGGWPALELPTQWNLNEGDSVATAGFPLRSWDNANVSPHLFSGVVSQIAGRFLGGKFTISELVVDMSVHPGNSGGPVFNVQTGELVGIVSSQTLRDLNVVSLAASRDSPNASENQAKWEEKVWTNITHCVPWPAIREGLEEMGLLKGSAQRHSSESGARHAG